MWGGQQLENLSESIVGSPSICIIQKHSAQQIQPYWYAAAGAQPFYKKILICPLGTPLIEGFAADAIFSPKNGRDYSLLLAYILGVASSGPVYIQSSFELPEQFIAALYKSAGGQQITLITLLQHYPQTILHYKTIFFPRLLESATTDIAHLIHFLRSSSLLTVSDDEIRAYIKELRVTAGALVWTQLGETRPRGSIYWYDPADCMPPAPTPAGKEQLQRDVFQGLQQLTAKMQQICDSEQIKRLH